MDYVGVRAIFGNTIDTKNFIGVVTEKSEMLIAETDYVLQFKIINYGTNNILNHIVYIDDDGSHNLISDNLNIANFPVVNTFTDENITKQERLCHIIFQVSETGKYKFGIARTQTSNDTPGNVAFDVRDVSVEKGDVLQAFKDNTNDIYNFIQRCETYFEQNDKRLLLMARKEDANKINAKIEIATDNILLQVNRKVNSDAIISSINMSPESIQIRAEKIDMSGALDLHGTFTCYADERNIANSNKLVQSAAIHRGYLAGWNKPVFSSGIWKPDGTNDVGFVSVGWSDSDHFDAHGCIYLSPMVGGGGMLSYGRKIDETTGVIVNSTIEFPESGEIRYKCFVGDKAGSEVYGHIFDSGISCYSLYAQNIKCTGWIECDSTLFTKKDSLFLVAGGYSNTYYAYMNKDGYFNPGNNVQLGDASHPWYQLICKYAPSVTSDMRKKTDICYIDCPAIDTFVMTDEKPTVPVVSREDMYKFVRDDLRLATYKLRDSREEDTNRTEIGFLAQDIMDTKVGKYIINDNDPDNLTYDMANRISVLEGALQKAIEKIELLEQAINNKEDAGR